MLAIVNVNGKQYQVEEGKYIDVDFLPEEVDAELLFSNVLTVVDGEKALVGAPYLAGAKVTAKVLKHGRNGKVLVYKMRCKKGYRRKNGHRQSYTRLQVVSISLPA